MKAATAYVLGSGMMRTLLLGAAEEHEERTFRAGSIGRFVKRHGLQMQASRLLVPPGHMDPTWEARHYQIIFTMGAKEFRTTMSLGMGLPFPPAMESVLGSVAHDAMTYEQYKGDFPDYASGFGLDMYDPFEYQKYLEFGKTMRAFREFLGDEAYQELLSLPEVQDR